MTTGQKVKYLRQRLGLTQEELANKLGYKSKSSIAHIEQDRDLPIDIIQRIAKILGTTGAYLMGWERDPEKVDFLLKALDNITDEQFELLLSYVKELLASEKNDE